ncbi:hypothetical protein [Rhodovibrio salinarum]|uniref:Uncharacterized protein n=1 Tax=Rhodovibrio salinarum TaxID=1087 RepID=A0A934V1V6_9PROT|nr:hypothetical protein [Rhodovibrio salinarum]MBK1698875.1 hypothetical protein [Rhodovibrio salinarum]
MIRLSVVWSAVAVLSTGLAVGSVSAADGYSDHLIKGFDKPAMRDFDPEKRIPVGKVLASEIVQKPASGGTGVIVELRSADDLVCLRLKPEAGRPEACVIAAVLSPCVCDYEVASVAQKQSGIGGLSGVVTPNGGACSCD